MVLHNGAAAEGGEQVHEIVDLLLELAAHVGLGDFHPVLHALKDHRGGGDVPVAPDGGGLAGKGLDVSAIAVLAVGGVLVAAVESRGLVSDWIRRQWFFVRWPLYWLLALALLLFGVFGQSAFIYQQY